MIAVKLLAGLKAMTCLIPILGFLLYYVVLWNKDRMINLGTGQPSPSEQHCRVAVT